MSQKTCLSFRCAPVTSDDRCGGFFVVQRIPLKSACLMSGNRRM
ncbi:hypothetical protein [Lacrimispora aerotolerans]|nr:hypothetical protein [Lacrimispora aerotolerans]